MVTPEVKQILFSSTHELGQQPLPLFIALTGTEATHVFYRTCFMNEFRIRMALVDELRDLRYEK